MVAAVVHLVRYGKGADAPWEVVGTDDTTFSLTSPRYGATVTSPFTAGGTITGVDESIRVEVHGPGASVPLGVACCRAAGGERSPWHEAVPFGAAPGTALVAVASTGGHVTATERFAVTGVWAAAGSVATAAACDPSVMLGVVKAALPLPPPDSTAAIRIDQCGGGYARVAAAPTNVNCGKEGGSCYNDEQVFLKDAGGSWAVLDHGTGIDCTKPQTTSAVVLGACRALGLV
jgi:hypothetical protein